VGDKLRKQASFTEEVEQSPNGRNKTNEPNNKATLTHNTLAKHSSAQRPAYAVTLHHTCMLHPAASCPQVTAAAAAATTPATTPATRLGVPFGEGEDNVANHAHNTNETKLRRTAPSHPKDNKNASH
jgi:hypothetical protein